MEKLEKMGKVLNLEMYYVLILVIRQKRILREKQMKQTFADIYIMC